MKASSGRYSWSGPTFEQVESRFAIGAPVIKMPGYVLWPEQKSTSGNIDSIVAHFTIVRLYLCL